MIAHLALILLLAIITIHAINDRDHILSTIFVIMLITYVLAFLNALSRGF